MPASHVKSYISINMEAVMSISRNIRLPGFHKTRRVIAEIKKTIAGSHPHRVNPILNKNLAKSLSYKKSNNKDETFINIAPTKKTKINIIFFLSVSIIRYPKSYIFFKNYISSSFHHRLL